LQYGVSKLLIIGFTAWKVFVEPYLIFLFSLSFNITVLYAMHFEVFLHFSYSQIM